MLPSHNDEYAAGNKHGRMFIFLYIALLHFVVGMIFISYTQATY